VHEIRVDIGGYIGGRVEQRVQFEHPQRAAYVRAELERLVNSRGGHTGDADQLLRANRPCEGHIVLGALVHGNRERLDQQVHLDADLIRDPDQCRVGERAEIDICEQLTRIVGHTFVVRVDRIQLARVGMGRTDDVHRRDERHLGVGLVDDDGPPAVRVLIALLDKTPSRFARYNLGVAQIKAGQVTEGTATLDALGNEPADTDENRALRDRTNVALGFAALKSRDAAAARRYLERVPLEGADSNKALLGYGWAAMEQQAPQSALVPWLALSKRDATDPAALEARMAVPYAYSQLRANGKAIQLYLDAIQTFEQERQNLDAAIDFVRSGRWLEALSAVWQIDTLPDVPYAAYLKGVLVQNAFREGYKNLRDLRGLTHNLQSRQDQVHQLEQALGSKRMTLEQYLKRVNAQAGAAKVAALRQQIDVLTAELAQSEARMDGLAFASPHQRDMLDTIGRLQAMTNKSGASPEIAKAKDRVRMVAGLLHWQIFQDEPTRVWKIKSALTDAREALVQADKRHAGIAQFLRDEPNRLDQFDGRVQVVNQTLQTLMPKVEALAAEQQVVLQNMAVADLFAQKDNLATYLVQARFAVAQLYDQATAANKSKNGVTPHSADNQDANNAPKP